MAFSPITSWQIDEETMTDYFEGLQNHCSHETKRCLLLGRNAMINLESKNITLPTKVHLIKAMVFPVVMYGCERWTIKKAKCQKMMLLNCGVGEDSSESLGRQGGQTSQF